MTTIATALQRALEILWPELEKRTIDIHGEMEVRVGISECTLTRVFLNVLLTSLERASGPVEPLHADTRPLTIVTHLMPGWVIVSFEDTVPHENDLPHHDHGVGLSFARWAVGRAGGLVSVTPESRVTMVLPTAA